ncbi:ABC transporter permease [Rhizobium sp. C4]|uniref:ABC transporter permease n=1 Tax=Rhizobium sp. C4 TaxID=1349800 RepID=UPI001E302B27|nr:ABC transporter permease [Rhizobium sp. C4]MCD2173422.1 ABC transporter permease [Rhizobium sp. C4]
MMRPINLLWLAASFLVTLALLALWQWIANHGYVSKVFLPGPDRAFAALTRDYSSGKLFTEVGQTVLRMALGWLVASAIGIGLGAAIGISPFARTWIAPTFEFIRPLPASAIAPVAIVFLGMTDNMILLLIAFGSVWPMLLTTIHGFSNVHPRLDEVARVLRLNRFERVYKIALPAAMPDILGGLRLGLTIALILAVVGEMITVQGGLGSRILLAARGFRAPDIFAGVIMLGLIGLATNVALTALERRLLRWQPAPAT